MLGVLAAIGGMSDAVGLVDGPRKRFNFEKGREVNDELAQQFRRERIERESRYREMLIRSGRVKQYAFGVIAINDKNAERKLERA